MTQRRLRPLGWFAAALMITLIAAPAAAQPYDDDGSVDEEYEYEPGEGIHEEEWYDPSDWFNDDGRIDYENDTYGYGSGFYDGLYGYYGPYGATYYEDFGDYGGDLHFAYTQRSWWQAYNADASSPFRETNFEPEVFIDFENRGSLLGWTNINNRLAFNHQSNGRSDPLSRSWNRLILESTFVNDDWALTLAPHWRIPESEEEDGSTDGDTDTDDETEEEA